MNQVGIGHRSAVQVDPDDRLARLLFVPFDLGPQLLEGRHRLGFVGPRIGRPCHKHQGQRPLPSPHAHFSEKNEWARSCRASYCLAGAPATALPQRSFATNSCSPAVASHSTHSPSPTTPPPTTPAPPTPPRGSTGLAF